MKYEVKTKLTGVKRKKDGKFEWKEEIIYMKWGKKEEERKAKGLLHISEYLGDYDEEGSKRKKPTQRKEERQKEKTIH